MDLILNCGSTTLIRYGFSRAQYVYALISGMGVFFLGAGVSLYHGVMSLLHPPILESLPMVQLLIE